MSLSLIVLSDALAAAPPPENGGGGGVVLLLLIGAAVYGIGYLISIRVHPYKACPRCHGSGKHRGTLFRSAFRACDRCGGVGREYRAFARRPYTQNDHKRRGRR